MAVLIGGNTFKYYLVERDDYVIDNIIQAEAEFMEMVENGVAPEISGHASDSDYLASAFPEDNGEIGELSDILEVYAKQYFSLQEQMKILQEEADYLKNLIKYEMKDFRILKSDDIRVNMPTIKKVSFNAKQFEKDHPELYQKYKNKESVYRSFLVKVSEA